MKSLMVCWIVLIGFLLTPNLANAQPASAPSTQQTGNAAVQTAADEQLAPKKLLDELSRTQIAKFVQGEKELTWEEVRKPWFWFTAIQNLIDTLIVFIPRLIGTLIFLFVFWLIYRGIRRVAMGSMKEGEVDSSIRNLLGAMIKWVVMGFGIVIACNQLGIPIAAMLATVSLVGLAVGFAAQETLANFIAGIVIFLDKPFKVTDWLTVDGMFAQVKRVSFRSTRLLTEDGEMVVFPNTYMLANRIVNHSDHPVNRVNIKIGIAYRSSIDEARRVLLGLCENDARLVKEPAAHVVVAEYADSSVNLLLRFWISDESLERKIRYEYLEKAKKAFDQAGVEIPFPHLQLLVEETPAIQSLAGASVRKAG